MQERALQDSQGLVTPSPSKRMIVAAIIPAIEIIRPRKRATIFLKVPQHRFSSTPKKAWLTLSIVDMPQRKPKIIPPRWVKLSMSGVIPKNHTWFGLYRLYRGGS